MTLLTTVEATTSPARTSILPVQAGTTLFTGWDGMGWMGLCVTCIVDPIVTPVSRYQCCNNSIVVRSFFFLGEDGGTIYIYPRTSRPW